MCKWKGYTHLLLCGPSGVGKSTVTRRTAERFVCEESNRAIVPVVWVEARPGDSGVYARLDYYRQVLSALREHAAVKDRLVQMALTPRPSRKAVEAAEQTDPLQAQPLRERGVPTYPFPPLTFPLITLPIVSLICYHYLCQHNISERR